MLDEDFESRSKAANALIISRPLASETTKSGESANDTGDCFLDTLFPKSNLKSAGGRNLKIGNLFGIRTVGIS
jgi:hypothetical protein